MAPISLALVWHQHQPYYPDDVGGENPMPWVRLHATKDYLGMALHLKEVPEFRCTINLVPSLLAQLEAYVNGATDAHLTLSRRPADGLSPRGRLRDPRLVLHGLPRHDDPAASALPRAVHAAVVVEQRGAAGPRPLPPARPPRPPGLVEPGVDPPAGLREGPRAGRVPRQGEALHRGGEALVPGQAARPARPGDPPAPRAGRTRPGRADDDALLSPDPAPAAGQGPGARGDAGRLAAVLSRRLSRRTPPSTSAAPSTAMPSGSARPRAACGPARARSARRSSRSWPSTASAGSPPTRRSSPARRTAWSAATAGVTSATPTGCTGPGGSARAAPSWRSSSAIIRCPTRSGSTTSAAPARSRPADFLGKVHAIGDACRHDPATLRPGDPRRRELLGVLPRRRRLVPPLAVPGRRARPAGPARCGSTSSSPSTRRASRDTLPRLFAGSWISHNFAIWIGHPEDNRAWDALHVAREFLVNEASSGRHDATALARAWDEIYIAEGSDWFWWFGDDHSSAQDALFDHLFRKHLRNVYTLLGCDPPGSLFTPIARGAVRPPLHDQPVSFLRVKLDGRAPYFEWIDAARYACGNDRGDHDAGRPRACCGRSGSASTPSGC